jgi:hypothetical protein
MLLDADHDVGSCALLRAAASSRVAELVMSSRAPSLQQVEVVQHRRAPSRWKHRDHGVDEQAVLTR